MSNQPYTYSFACPTCNNSFKIQFHSIRKKHKIEFQCKKCYTKIKKQLDFKTNESIRQLFDRPPTPSRIKYRKGNINASFLFETICYIKLNEFSNEVILSLNESKGAEIMIKGEWDTSFQRMNMSVKNLNSANEIRLYFADSIIDIPYVFTPIQNDEILYLGDVDIQLDSYSSLYTTNTPEYT